MLIGYARVSTSEQDLRLQLDALKLAGCERIFTDKASGKRSDRQGLSDAFAYLRPGDCLVVWKLDRLGRSMKGLVDLSAELEAAGIDLRSLTDGIDTKTPAGRFFFHIMAALAVMERDLIVERTKAGLSSARAQGRVGGRPSVVSPAIAEAIASMVEGGETIRSIAAKTGVSRSTVYRQIRKADGA